jgi:hypothetical protein
VIGGVDGVASVDVEVGGVGEGGRWRVAGRLRTHDSSLYKDVPSISSSPHGNLVLLGIFCFFFFVLLFSPPLFFLTQKS